MNEMQQSIPTAYRAWGAAAALAFALTACQDASAPDAKPVLIPPVVSSNTIAPGRQLADEYVVVLNNGVTDVRGRANALLKAHGGELRAAYTTALKGFAAHMSAQAANVIADDPGVAYVEPVQVFEPAGGVQVEDYPGWGLDRIDQGSAVLDAKYYYSATGTGVNVYIIDSGILRTNVEFGGRVSADFSSAPDGLGPDACPNWHGTHAAGVVGGAKYGVAKNVRMHVVRAYDCANAGTTTSILAAIDWVTANRTRPAVALMAMQGVASLAFNTAIENSMNAGIPYVVAAGNNSADACQYSPANVPGAITVAAIAGAGLDDQAIFTNYGPCVDLYAPGSQIYGADVRSDTALSNYTGTSDAAAFVAGAAALYLESNSTASATEVAQAIINGATQGAVRGVTGNTPNRLLRVNGSGGGSQTPPPGNTAPVPNFTATCNKAACSFNASSSTDDAGVSKFGWTFGDGSASSSSSPMASHTYSTKGTYSVTVTLTVTDTGGLSASKQQSLTIRNKGK